MEVYYLTAGSDLGHYWNSISNMGLYVNPLFILADANCQKTLA